MEQAVYSTYSNHPLGRARTEEGMISSKGHFIPRTKALFDYIDSTLNLKSKIRMMDYGCGQGNTLKRALDECPDWNLSGYEISERSEALYFDNNDVKLYFGNTAITDSFDLITMVHVLEHVPQIRETLLKLYDLLVPGGHIVAIVPNIKEHPFQLMIADHFSQFTTQSLQLAFASCGFEIIDIQDDFIKKELIILCKKPLHKIPDDLLLRNLHKYFEPNTFEEVLTPAINYLDALLNLAKSTQSYKQVGILGTSIAAGWLYAQSPNLFSFFVDEDKSVIGQFFQGKMIFSPEDAPAGSAAIISQPRSTAGTIFKRLHTINPDVHWTYLSL